MLTWKQYQDRALLQCLVDMDFSPPAAMRSLRCARSTMYRRLAALGLKKRDFKGRSGEELWKRLITNRLVLLNKLEDHQRETTLYSSASRNPGTPRLVLVEEQPKLSVKVS